MKYEQGLERTGANHAPLTPLAFIERAAAVYPDRLAVIDEGTRHVGMSALIDLVAIS